jgi:signal transduction histidine kinase
VSLRGKLFGAISFTLCIVMVSLVWVALVLERARQSEIERHQRLALTLAGELVRQIPAAALPDTNIFGDAGQLTDGLRAIYIFEFDDDAQRPRLLVRRGRATRDPELRRQAEELAKECASTGQIVRRGTKKAAPQKRDESDGRLRVAYVEVEQAGIAADQVARYTFLVVVTAAALLGLLVWFIVGRVVSRPLREVALAARRVGDGDYSHPVPRSAGDDEIQRVVAAFNQMMEEVSALQTRLQEDIGEEVAKEKRTQASLVIAQRLGATGQLAAGIAHEVNNPLGGLMNAVHALATKDVSDERRREYLELIDDGLKRIQATVSKILQFTPHKVAPREVDLADVVRPTIALARHRIEQDGVQVVLEMADDAVVFADPYELQQALLNVVLNALDALADAEREQPEILIRSTRAEESVEILVRDNGTGMSEAEIDRAFDLFFTTKETGRGSGLGLATAHKIVTDHGGRLELASREGEGMDVLFVLPRERG